MCILSKGPDLVSIDNEMLVVMGNLAWKTSMNSVVLQLINHVVQFHEWIVDRDHFHTELCAIQRRPQDESSNAAKSVDSNLDGSHVCRHLLFVASYYVGYWLGCGCDCDCGVDIHAKSTRQTQYTI